ncbi:MAG: hypothetical protein IJ150_04560 [Bacteroidales bacterium]|jgi:hypothetical protein|nr:hypothetical protein [Bacteroidales bacterium]
MENILSKEFEQYRDEFNKRLDYERKCFDEMSKALDECNQFNEKEAKPNDWKLTDKQKAEEERLLDNFKSAIEKWDKAHKDFIAFPKTK